MTIDATILMLDNGVASTVVGPLEVLMSAGTAWNRFTHSPSDPKFKVRLASIDGQPCTSMSGVKIDAHCGIDQVSQTELIIVSSSGDTVTHFTDAHQRALVWLRQHYDKGAVISSVCAGACLLAAAGLLDGRKATTHWGLVDKFRRQFPNVTLTPESLIVDEGNIITCGGGSAGNDLALYLVERFLGKRFAHECAQAMLLENGRHLQKPFAELLHHKTHQDTVIKEAQDFMETHYAENISLDELACAQNMSPRNFKRRFEKATGEMPLLYLQKVRIQAAKNVLATTKRPVDLVGIQVGYQDCNYFRQLFKRLTGLSPTEFRGRFRRIEQ